MIGQVVGKYQLLDKIGEGGMGTVYRAQHTVLGSPAAVKVLLPMWTEDAVVVDRFFHEAKAASAIHHVGIVDVFDFGRLPNEQAWIAMEYLPGENLTQFLARSGGRLDPAVAQIIGAQLLGALDAAHITGVIHRDLKPDNIVIVRDPSAPGAVRVKILDFGIAKLGSDRFGAKMETKGGTILGTPAYMAPEQCRNMTAVDARADLYALGCILFELLTGRPPFLAETGVAIVRMHLDEPPPRVVNFAPHVGIELDSLIAKLLEKSPDDRVPSAAYALAALERISLPPIGDVHLLARGPLHPHQTELLEHPLGAPPSRSFPIVVILIAILIAVAAVVGIGLYA